MDLEFSFKYQDFELRACPPRLARLSPEEKNETIELIKWLDVGKTSFCYTLGYFVKYSEGYYFKFVGDRMFNDVVPEDIKILWPVLKLAQQMLDDFFNSEEVKK